jgi:hypothetical protein
MITPCYWRLKVFARQRFSPTLIMIVFAANALVLRAAAQVPDALLYTLEDPSTNLQSHAHQGHSVAVNGNVAVTGSPDASRSGTGGGVVKVYDATSGAVQMILLNPSGGGDVDFGAALALSGTRLVVGAPWENAGADNAGIAYVYELTGSTPTVPVLTLTNPSPTASDEFGYAVAVSGTRVVVGAYLDDTGAANTGIAYVFDTASATPTIPMLTLTNPVPRVGDNFGISVGIAGTRIVIGAHLADGSINLDSGRAYIYDLTNAVPWMPMLILENPLPLRDGGFGYSVAMDGLRLAIGAPRQTKRTYVYDLSGVTPGTPTVTVTNPSPDASGLFGWSVAISGTRLVVGAPYEDAGATNAGNAYAYDLASATPFIPTAILQNPTVVADDHFGQSVAVSGTRAVIGAPDDDAWAPDAGSAYVYDLAGGMPTVPAATLNDPNPAGGHGFGWSAGISGTRVAVGTPFERNGGSVYVYNLVGSTPTVAIRVLTNPVPASREFGSSVSVSGLRVAVGSRYDDTGTNDAGAAYIYTLNSATPTVPSAILTNPAPATSDEFGSSVSISGTRVVVGAPWDNAGMIDAGSAYAYDLASATPTVPITLTNPSPSALGLFGAAVAIAGTRIIVGAYQHDLGQTMNVGIAYVYDLAGASPGLAAVTLTNPTPSLLSYFGRAVAISGTRAVVGSPGSSIPGKAFVYDLTSATPTVPVLTLTNPSPAAGERFGWAVAIFDTRVVVAAYDTATAGDQSGTVHVYDLGSATPREPVLTLNNPDPAIAQFGYAVSLDGTTLVTSTPAVPKIDGPGGAAYVYGAKPTLNIAKTTPGFAAITWTPTVPPAFRLQHTERSAPGGWVTIGGASPVFVRTTNATRLYRLIKP